MRLLFRQLDIHGLKTDPNIVRRRHFVPVALRCSTDMMRLFLPEWSAEDFEELGPQRQSVPMKRLDSALFTPHLEMFEFLMRIKRTTPYPELNGYQLTRFLGRACKRGSEVMVRHLLALGAPLTGHDYGFTPVVDSLLAACLGESGHGTPCSVRIVRILLSHGAEIRGTEVAVAMKAGNMDLVQTLVDAGADVNEGRPTPLVTAIALERTDLFEALVGLGARLDDEVRRECVETARVEGLESMLAFLEGYGVDVGEPSESRH